MSQYATIEQMEEMRGAKLVQRVSDKDRSGERIDTVVNAALSRASSLADAFIDKKYQVPLSNPPEFLVAAIIDIALYQMAADVMTGTDEMRKRFDDANALLKNISKGAITLAGNEPAAAPSSGVKNSEGSQNVMTIVPKRVFGRDTEIM